MVRKKAVNTNLVITVGTLGVMTLEGNEIYLDPDFRKLPVPRYLFKIITTKKSGRSEVYIFFNNPHGTQLNIEAEITGTFGDKVQPLNGDFVDVTKGYTFKMEYADFLKAVNLAFKGYKLPRSLKEE